MARRTAISFWRPAAHHQHMSDADSEPVTVALIPAARAAVTAAAGLLGLSETDVINRAVVAYAFLEEELSGGGEVVVRREDGTVLQVMFL